MAFYNRTGISPAVITVENSDWQGYYSDLENYAYDLYVNHFADESHWLIVYSTPDGYSSSDGFEDWYWEGMQGNDTDDVLTKSVTNSFNDELQKNLTARTRYTVSSAISTSFDDLTPTVMKSKVNWTMLFILDRHSGICVSARLPYDRHKSKGEKICQSKAVF